MGKAGQLVAIVIGVVFLAMHPELRNGLADEHIRRLYEDMRAPMSLGLVARFLRAVSGRHAQEPVQASRASFTRTADTPSSGIESFARD